MHRDIEKILVTEEQIKDRVEELAEEILARGCEDIMIVILLKGALVFAADLFREMPIKLDVECLNISSYHGGVESSGKVDFLDKSLPDFSGKRVIVVDDIFDTGLTMKVVCEEIIRQRAKSVESCVLLAKEKVREIDFKTDYVGFVIGDEFVVGYGLDYRGKYRNLPCIGVLSESAI